MKIHEGDYREILDHMVKQRWEGNEYVAFLADSDAVGKEELFCFATPYEAKEFCYEMSTDLDHYDYMAIRSVYRTMSEALQDKNLRIETGGLVNISAMVSIRVQQMEEQQIINNQNNKVMNQNNLDYLQDQVKYTGFGEGLQNDLKTNIEQQPAEFKLKYDTQYGNDNMSAILHFSKSKESDMYFFNKYDASLQKENAAESLDQTFYINKGNNITLKEAYNMMEGRSVNKELTNKNDEKYQAWVQIDFKNSDDKGNFKLKQYHENYGFDLEAALSKHPIKELQNQEYKADLINSLKKGNLQSATFEKNGQEVKQYIEASPQFKNIKVHSIGGEKQEKNQDKSEKQSLDEKASNKKDKKESQSATGDDGADATQKKNSRKKAQSL